MKNYEEKAKIRIERLLKFFLASADREGRKEEPMITLDNHDGTVTVTQKSPLSGDAHSMRIAMPYEKFMEAYGAFKRHGLLVQYAFPRLSPDEREFILTGITPKEWKEVFSETE